MNQIFLKLNTDKLKKLKETTEFLKDSKDYSKSDYWKHCEGLNSYKFNSKGIFIRGGSGHYYPRRKTFKNLIRTKLSQTIRNTAFKACCGILNTSKLGRTNELPSLILPSTHAYDSVWSNSSLMYDSKNGKLIRISENSQIFDFRSVQIPKELKSHKLLQKNWHLKNHFLMNDKFFLDFYSYFVTHHFCEKPSNILEIGGGNGNLASIFHYYSKSRITLVDIPTTIVSAIAFLSYVFPDAKMLYPQDMSPGKDLNSCDFCFILPDQTISLSDSSFDLAINNGSFQEMTSEQIDEYFKLIYRVLKDNGIFSTLNRVEKVPSKETKPIRFSEYPYTFVHEILLHEIDPFMRLIQRDNHFHKIVKVTKP
ncbi:MAG: putative sugar O-methyltransferase [Planctomycetes bacterium]|nr:putative sugar O-methyltransferase [Planctomycetota bacterium]